ncbi:MAG TPA: hypothetical protein VFQ38_04715 [Longimicrobiales bacterium]|nr:hypothetical protein [Longimicrobiales bacterium]
MSDRIEPRPPLSTADAIRVLHELYELRKKEMGGLRRHLGFPVLSEAPSRSGSQSGCLDPEDGAHANPGEEGAGSRQAQEAIRAWESEGGKVA